MKQIKISDLLFCEKDLKFTFNRITYVFDRVVSREGSMLVSSQFYTTNMNCTFSGIVDVLVDPDEYEKQIIRAIDGIFLNTPDMVIKRDGEVCVAYGCYGEDTSSGVIEIPVELDLRPWEEEYKVYL